MPLVAVACLAYAVGLFAAQVLAPPAIAMAAGLALGAGVLVIVHPALGSRRHLGPCLLLAAAGALTGAAASVRDRECAGAIVAAHDVRAAFDDDASPGTLAHARLRLGECAVWAAVLVRRGSALAGDEALVRGEAMRGPRGVVIRDAELAAPRAVASLATVRGRIGRRIDRVFGRDAPLVRALVIADMSAIPAGQRDRFARAGLVHMLSVSGLHVAIVALALALLASAARIPPAPAGVATMAIIGAYVLLIGAPPPAVRAAVMLALVMATRLCQRPSSRWAIVAVGSAVPLVDPSVVADLGWQLSVAGTIALVAGGALARRLVPRAWRGMRRSLATAAVVSVVATTVTAPLVAWTFGRLALLGPVTNLVADPVMGLLQPLLFLALCVPFAPIERLCADAAHVLILLFDAIATHAAALPFAAPVVLPTVAAACAAGLGALAIVAACMARDATRPLAVAALSLVVMIAEPLLPRRASATELHMIDVGQGDAIALRTRAGRWVVVDAGRTWNGGDAGAATVVPYIAHRGGDVALFIMSHPHADHVGGAASLFDALHPAAFLDPGYPGGTPPYLAALAAARRDRIPWRRAHPGDSVVVDEAVVTVLAPDSAWAVGLADANLASAVVSVRVGQVRILLTGDAEAPEEAWLLAHAPALLRADVLKVGHHGSSTSSTAPFLAEVRPRVALVSVGAHNSYGHPSAEVMDALRSGGAEVLRSDRLGTVVVRTDGESLEVEAGGARWAVPARLPR